MRTQQYVQIVSQMTPSKRQSQDYINLDTRPLT